MYFSFGNIYSSKILNYQSFQEQFQSGIYQYRILSAYFLAWSYKVISSLDWNTDVFKLKFFDERADPIMFLAFYVLNTAFLVLTGIVLVLLAESKKIVASATEKLLMISVTILIVALSQFVIVPYDISSYFFLMLFFLVFLEYLSENSTINLIFLSIILIIATLNRESSAISISLATAVLFTKFGSRKECFFPVLVLIISFAIPYFGMRFWHQNFTTNDGSLLFENFSQPKNILGLLFWLVLFIFSLLLSNGTKNVRLILLFHGSSLPYIFMCFYTGIIYEFRLYIPVFLTSLFLSKMKLPENSNLKIGIKRINEDIEQD